MKPFRTSFGCKLPVSLAVAMLALVMTVAILSSAPPAQTPTPPGPLPTDQIIIKYKTSAGVTRTEAAQVTRQQSLSRVAGVNLTYFREMSGDAHVLKLPARRSEAEVSAIASKLMALPDVEYAVPDRVGQLDFIPNDPEFTNQWSYSGVFGINAPAAWDITSGSSSLIVAVIDTGILGTHPDIAGRTVAGYDFVSNVWRANDGDGRDADPGDPGDWVMADDCFPGSQTQASSWHGTHVAGIIGAASNNGVGVSGVNWNARLLPVRVSGRCGLYMSDTADAIRWAAGGSVSGVPENANPARILNLSLGGNGACDPVLQTAIDDARSRNAVIVVSAGNDNNDASVHWLSNCTGVVVVASTDSAGQKASDSNFGSVVDISAPGVNILSTGNLGRTSPGIHSSVYYSGTSQAAPHVAGVASLALTMRPNLTPDQVEQLLQDSVTAFPTGSSCTTSLCGTGIVNAELAVRDIYVHKYYGGVKLGTRQQPFNTITEANTAAWDGAWIKVNAGSFNEIVTFSKRLTIVSDGGIVIIGQ